MGRVILEGEDVGSDEWGCWARRREEGWYNRSWAVQVQREDNKCII